MRARYAYTLTIAILAGIVVAFVFDENRTVSVLSFSLRYAVPLILAAMVGIICERSGIINIGIISQNTNNRPDKILYRNQAINAAIFIKNNGKMDLGKAHLHQ